MRVGVSSRTYRSKTEEESHHCLSASDSNAAAVVGVPLRALLPFLRLQHYTALRDKRAANVISASVFDGPEADTVEWRGGEDRSQLGRHWHCRAFRPAGQGTDTQAWLSVCHTRLLALSVSTKTTYTYTCCSDRYVCEGKCNPGQFSLWLEEEAEGLRDL